MLLVDGRLAQLAELMSSKERYKDAGQKKVGHCEHRLGLLLHSFQFLGCHIGIELYLPCPYRSLRSIVGA